MGILRFIVILGVLAINMAGALGLYFLYQMESFGIPFYLLAPALATLLLLSAAFIKGTESRVLPESDSDGTFDNLHGKKLERALRQHEKQWKRESAMRRMLFHEPNAPLRAQYKRCESRLTAASERYNHASKVATVERNATHQAADEKLNRVYSKADHTRDRAYSNADTKRDRAYSAADIARDKEYVQADRTGDTARHSRAYAEHRQAHSAAYALHRQKYSNAYAIHQQAWSNAYSEHRDTWNTAYTRHQQLNNNAWKAKDVEERTAREELERALEQYLAQHPNVLKQFFPGDEEKARKSRFSITSTRMLTIPALVERASRAIHGEQDVSLEETSSLVAALHDWLQRPTDGDPYAELRDRARGLMRKLITRLN